MQIILDKSNVTKGIKLDLTINYLKLEYQF
jgi:hypothetical protein